MTSSLDQLLDNIGIGPEAEKRAWEKEIKKREKLAPYKFLLKAHRRRFINWHHNLNHYQRMAISITLPVGAACFTNALPWWIELLVWPLTIWFSVGIGLWIWCDYEEHNQNTGLEFELSEIKEALKEIQGELATGEWRQYLQCIEDELLGIKNAIEASDSEPELNITGNRTTYQDWERSLE